LTCPSHLSIQCGFIRDLVSQLCGEEHQRLSAGLHLSGPPLPRRFGLTLLETQYHKLPLRVEMGKHGHTFP
jgi:hypothetical protein